MKSRRIVLTIFVLLCITASGYSQSVSGTIPGTTTDQTSATVPAAKVTLTGQNTGVTRNSETAGAGCFAFPDFAPGIYTVSIEMPGFKRSVRTDPQVLANATVRVDMQLQTGDVTESIEVTAEAALLGKDRTDTGRKIEVE